MPPRADLDAGACKSCGAPIVWGKTDRGRSAPFDVVNGRVTRTNHFRTCPDAQKWSRSPRYDTDVDVDQLETEDDLTLTPQRVIVTGRCGDCASDLRWYSPSGRFPLVCYLCGSTFILPNGPNMREVFVL